MDVLVLGGGVAGLSSALAFARRGHAVTLVERDRQEPPGPPEQAFTDWGRPGVAHFRQPHHFLGLARRTLRDEAPDVLDELLRLGSLDNDQRDLIPGTEAAPGDEDLRTIGCRRPVFEATLRAAVDGTGKVGVRAGVRVRGPIWSNEARPPWLLGVRTEGGEELRADLVVDAMGRTSPLWRWLEDAGHATGPERVEECGLLYFSRHFRFRDGVDVPEVRSLMRAPRGEIGYLGYSIFRQDNRTFALAVMIPTWDEDLKRALRDDRAYMAAIMAIPPLVPWVAPEASEAISPVLPMGAVRDVFRPFVVDGDPAALGVHPVGDALCHTNPTFAYGCSLSLHHGFTLARLADRATDARDLALAFHDAVGRDAEARFEAVSAEDRDRIGLWRGEPLDPYDPGSSLPLFLRMGVLPAAMSDADVFRAVARRVNLLDPPDALANDHGLIERASAIARDAPKPPPAPRRAELLAAIAAA